MALYVSVISNITLSVTDTVFVTSGKGVIAAMLILVLVLVLVGLVLVLAGPVLDKSYSLI